ncbi:MAG: hypothetical protein AB7V04_01860 [Desulfomonilaceae bacterium]
MSEIRSTIDIMMERTRGMGLSENEKEQIRKDALEKKARGYVLKIHDYPDSTQKIIDDLMSENSSDLEELKRLVWNGLVSKIQNDTNLMTFLERLEKLPLTPSKVSVLNRYKSLIKEALKDKSKDRKSLIDRERKKLADSGISGSAVVPIISKESENKGIDELIKKLRSELTDTF